MTSLATAFVEVRADTSRVGSDISRGTSSAADRAGSDSGKRFSSRFGSALKVGALLAGAFAVTKGAAFLGDSIREASNLNESLNAVNVTFGKSAGGITKLGKEAAEAVGLSNSEFNGLAVQFSAFAGVIAGKGGDVVKTIDDLSTRGADFASVMNLDVNEAMTLFQSGLAGETEPLRKFGINLSAAAVEAHAYKTGIAAVGTELTENQKVQARYSLLMKQTAKTQGDFANTSDDLANKQRILGAQFDNLKAAIGVRLLPVATKLVTWVSDFVAGMQDGTGAGGTFARIMGTIGDVLGRVGGFIRDVVVPWLGQLKGKLVEAMGGTEGFKKTMSDLQPVVTLIMAALGALFRYILFSLPILIRWWKLLATTLGIVAEAAMFVWNSGFQPMLKFITLGLGKLMMLWGRMLQALGKVPGFGWAKKAGDLMFSAGQKAVGLSSSIKKIPTKHDTKVNAETKKASAGVAAFKAAVNLLPKTHTLTIKVRKIGAVAFDAGQGFLPNNAMGTTNWRGGLTWVGEKGPEILNLPRGSQIIPNHEASRLASRVSVPRLAADGAGAYGSQAGRSVVQNIYETTDARATAAESARRLAWAGVS